MRRREYLATAAGSLALFAGCSGGSASETGTTTKKTETNTTSETTTDTDPVSLESFTAPDAAPWTDTLEFDIVLTNSGNTSVEREVELSVETITRPGVFRTISVTIPAEESVTRNVTIRPEGMGDITVSIPDFDESRTVHTKSVAASFGETVEFVGYELTTTDPLYTDTITYEKYDGTATATAPDGRTYAVLTATIEGGEEDFILPTSREVYLDTEETTYQQIRANGRDMIRTLTEPVSQEVLRGTTVASAGVDKKRALVYEVDETEIGGTVSVRADWKGFYPDANRKIVWE